MIRSWDFFCLITKEPSIHRLHTINLPYHTDVFHIDPEKSVFHGLTRLEGLHGFANEHTTLTNLKRLSIRLDDPPNGDLLANLKALSKLEHLRITMTESNLPMSLLKNIAALPSLKTLDLFQPVPLNQADVDAISESPPPTNSANKKEPKGLEVSAKTYASFQHDSRSLFLCNFLTLELPAPPAALYDVRGNKSYVILKGGSHIYAIEGMGEEDSKLNLTPEITLHCPVIDSSLTYQPRFVLLLEDKSVEIWKLDRDSSIWGREHSIKLPVEITAPRKVTVEYSPKHPPSYLHVLDVEGKIHVLDLSNIYNNNTDNKATDEVDSSPIISTYTLGGAPGEQVEFCSGSDVQVLHGEPPTSALTPSPTLIGYTSSKVHSKLSMGPQQDPAAAYSFQTDAELYSISCAEIAPDCSLVAVGNSSGITEVIINSVFKPDLIGDVFLYIASYGPVRVIRFSHNRYWVFVFTDHEVKLVDLENNTMLWSVRFARSEPVDGAPLRPQLMHATASEHHEYPALLYTMAFYNDSAAADVPVRYELVWGYVGVPMIHIFEGV